jgi:hypothetical protein
MQESKLGLEYEIALKEISNVRLSRRDQYGDTYLEDDYLFLKYQVENKMKRLDLQIKREGGKEIITNKTVALDSAIDAANYAIFIVSKILKQCE